MSKYLWGMGYGVGGLGINRVKKGIAGKRIQFLSQTHRHSTHKHRSWFLKNKKKLKFF